MTNIAAATTSPKMSGVSSVSRSCRQITHTRRPDGISASIRYEPSRRGSRRIIRLYAASTSSADRAWAAIFSRFHSIHLNRRIRAPYQRGQSSIQREASDCIRLGRHAHNAGILLGRTPVSGCLWKKPSMAPPTAERRETGSTKANLKKPKVFRGSQPPHPVAVGFIHGLLVMPLTCRPDAVASPGGVIQYRERACPSTG